MRAGEEETARALVLGEEIAERGFADWLAPERALVTVRTIDAHRRGAAKPPGPRELIAGVLPDGAAGARLRAAARPSPDRP
jgi:hypothetical protein